MHSDGVRVDDEEMVQLIEKIRAIAQRAEEFDRGIRRDSDLLAGRALPGEGADSRQMFAAVQERNIESERQIATLVDALRWVAENAGRAQKDYLASDTLHHLRAIPECRESSERIGTVYT